MNDSTTHHPEPHEPGRIDAPVSDIEIVPYLSIEVEDGLPATPAGLVNIATIFENHSYARLGRYLRACSDQMAAVATSLDRPSAAVSRFETAHAGGSFELLAVISAGDHPLTSEILLRSRDDVLHSLAVGSRVDLMPATSVKAEG